MAVISRFIVGFVFVFSGFVKSVDPLGTAYKFEEYINVFGFMDLLQWSPRLPVALSILLCSVELWLGLMLVLNLQRKTATWLVTIMMLFFTVLTFTDALTNKVTDCGCFGDAIKLTNWQTFLKNVVLDFFVVFLFLARNHPKEWLSGIKSVGFALLLFLLAILFAFLNYHYEPMIDFRPWKEGARMVPKEQIPPISYALYKNNNTGETKEYSMEDLMETYKHDSNFASQWTWVSTRVLNETMIAADGFSMTPMDEEKDVSTDYLYQEQYLFFVTACNLNDLNENGMEKILKFSQQAMEQGHEFAILTASAETACANFLQNHPDNVIPIYYSDDKAIKTMMRSNPGLMVMKNGVVLKKWSARCIPEFNEVNLEALYNKYKDR